MIYFCLSRNRNILSNFLVSTETEEAKKRLSLALHQKQPKQKKLPNVTNVNTKQKGLKALLHVNITYFEIFNINSIRKIFSPQKNAENDLFFIPVFVKARSALRQELSQIILIN